ncbi:hypothetical protein ABEB36_007823 [Hypothenemus hampei]|uniref:Ribonuclease P protein subunit p29 n=1 Tax=Hypothenemus hampei TaxID=57062 RepID=A0ABD1EVA5_HYPHA
MSKNLPTTVNSPLPTEIIKGQDIPKEEALSLINTYLKQVLPSSDQKNLKSEFKWQFLLQRHSLVKPKRRKQKKTFLTRKQRKEMKLLKLPEDGWNYNSLEPMRNLWKEYMRENLGLIKKAPSCIDQEWNTFSAIVAKSEMVGAVLKVIKSKVPSLVGLYGTIMLETKMSFQILTPENKLKTILKETSIFEFVLDHMRFKFLGKHLTTRPSDRSVRKIKNLLHPDL